MVAGETRQQVLYSVGKTHVSTGTIQSLQPDQDSGTSKADREDIQRTKVSVFSPRAGGAPAAIGRPSRAPVLEQCGSVPPSQAPRPPRGRARGLLPGLLLHRRQQQLRRAGASIKQLELRLLSKLPKQPIERAAAALKELLWDIWRAGTGPGAEQAAPCHGPEAAPGPGPGTSP